MKLEHLRIPSSVRQDECEDYLSWLSQKSVGRLYIPDRLPSNGAIGLEANVLQLIVKWARVTKESVLVLPVTNSNAKKFTADISLYAYGLTALALAKKVETKDGQKLPESTIRAVLKKRLDSFNDRNFSAFADASGASFLSIYNHSQEEDNWPLSRNSEGQKSSIRRDIPKWSERLISQLLPKDVASKFDEKRLNALGIASYELIENAVLHGRLDEYAEAIPIGVCGITIRVLRVPFTEIEHIAGLNRDVSFYFAQRLLKDKTKDGLFFELTVFDSGIGYHRWINAECNKANVSNKTKIPEQETILSCLQKHATSRMADGAGIGLFRVVTMLKQMFGFIRIRTGKTCVYARLDQILDGTPRKLGGNYDEAENPAINLEQWFPNKNLDESSGTSVTICVPLTHWH